MSTIDALLDEAGRTFADEAGISLEDEPAPLYRLLVLSVLLSRRVQAQLGIRACRELVDSGMGTPDRMRDASWQERIEALGRARYRSTEQTAGDDLARLAAALVRADRDDDVREEVSG
jgi:hypothetical protein